LAGGIPRHSADPARTLPNNAASESIHVPCLRDPRQHRIRSDRFPTAATWRDIGAGLDHIVCALARTSRFDPSPVRVVTIEACGQSGAADATGPFSEPQPGSDRSCRS
jgi:hypothetical protein